MALTWGYGLLLSLLFVPIMSPLSAHAEEAPNIRISEINWGGSAQSTADEWLEIANLTSTQISLANWQIIGAAPSGGTLTLPSEAVIPARGTYLVANFAPGDKSTLGVTPDLVTSDLSLPNDKLTLSLLNDRGETIDSLLDPGKPDFGSSSPASSMERDLSTLTWLTATERINLQSTTQLGTPGMIKVISAIPVEPAPEVGLETSIDIKITEIVSDPIAPGNEWVEIYNASPTLTADLSGWNIQDASGAVTTLEGIIPPENYAIIESPLGQLNNSTETITLSGPNVEAVSVTYGTDLVPAPRDGESLAIVDDTWIVSPAPTPALPNYAITEASNNPPPGGVAATVPADTSDTHDSLPTVTPPPPEASVKADRTLVTSVVSPVTKAIQAARAAEAPELTRYSWQTISEAPLGQMVEWQTTALAEPGVTSKQILIVAGGEVYFSKANWPAIEVGDQLTMTGKVSRVGGNLRLRLTSPENMVVEGGGGELEAAQAWGEAPEGTLATLSGKFISKKQQKILLDVNGETVPVYLAKDISLTLPKNTDVVTVTGIARHRNNELALQVVDDASLTFSTKPEIATGSPTYKKGVTTNQSSGQTVPSGTKSSPILGGGIISGTLALAGSWYAKARKANLAL